MAARVRQNPATATVKVSGQWCPAHGQYETPPGVGDAQRAAIGQPGVEVAQARSLLEYAARMRRTCPRCDGTCPTSQTWAIQVRTRRTTAESPQSTKARFVMPPRVPLESLNRGAVR